MPFCSQCGNQVGDADVFCARCGARQPVAPTRDPFPGLSPRTAAILCYIPVMGWIAAIVVLAADRFRDDRTVRFHAFQGLYLFVAWLLVDHVVGPVFSFVPHHFHLGFIFRGIVLAAWIVMLVKASHEEVYSLPIIGELAERSVAER